LAETLASQIELHAAWGGVVPMLAKREHIKNLPILLDKISRKTPRLASRTDLIAVTVGPGLEPALWAGIEFAKELAKKWGKPLIGTNHMEGHLFSPLLDSRFQIPDSRKPFPAVALVVSGGHSMLLRLADTAHWKLLGETRDDAAGEAFDKVARLLNLPYPGGPEISKRAKLGRPSIPFPMPMLHSKDYDFSFSGLKTAVLYHLKGLGYRVSGIADSAKNKTLNPIPDTLVNDVAASFEFAAVGVLCTKAFRAVDQYGARSVWIAGGVAANASLRKAFEAGAAERGISLFAPDMAHNTDNAAMIGAAAYLQALRKKKRPLRAKGDMQT
jgi:N6-L-threonylcarbamoyladenine synthase